MEILRLCDKKTWSLLSKLYSFFIAKLTYFTLYFAFHGFIANMLKWSTKESTKNELYKDNVF